MSNYEEWNSAIENYFTAGAPKGSHIFLSLDDEAIEDIAVRFLNENVDNEPVENFLAAVRERCVLPMDNGITLRNFQKDNEKVPGGVGFLGVMVLAAYRMQEEEGIDESNYFLRLREGLHLTPLRGRPDGMPPGAEEHLWIEWNNFLVHSGFQPTAERGTGPQTFLRYVLSQAILRESDKKFLRQRYFERKLPLQFDRDQLGFWLSRQQINRKHLNEGLHHIDPARVWEFYRAAYRVYETGDWLDGEGHRSPVKLIRTRNIEGGIYRGETLSGDVQYYLFPKQPERSRSNQLFVSRKDGVASEPLHPLREGYFRPLWVQKPFVEEPLQFPLSGDPYIQCLTFPKRDFWILTSDPVTPYGAFATWKPYLELGEKLLVLCQKGAYVTEMSRLKDMKLIDWKEHVQCNEWVEYYDCMVLSYDWSGFIGDPLCRALVNSLAPRTPAGISLVGGLRDRNQNAWLDGFPPSLKIYGFEKQFDVTVTATRGIVILKEEISRQEEISLDQDLKPDVYEVEVKWNGRRVAARMFRIISWDDIQENPDCEEVVNSQHISTSGLHLCGPIIVDEMRNAEDAYHA